MVTYGIIVGTFIAASVVEARCRNGGNITGAMAARRFGQYFLISAGLALSWQWISGMLALLH